MKKYFENGINWRFKNAPLEGFLFKDDLKSFHVYLEEPIIEKGWLLKRFSKTLFLTTHFLKSVCLNQASHCMMV